jgi:protein-tyrosine phosphatase
VSIDPTAFEIDFDPTVQRMRGTAVHGNKYFDVPFISEIVPGFYQGGCQDGLILPPNIKHVISLYKWEKYTIQHELESSLTVTMYDSLQGPDREQILALATWVNVCRQTGPTLVHCQAGLNRSGLVAGLALVLDGMPNETAIAVLRANRSGAVLCNPVFDKWLLEFQP